MTGSLWFLVLCYIVLAVAPLWYMYRTHELGSRRIARFAFWIALVMLGVGSAILTLYYDFPAFLMFFIAILYPILRVFMEDSLHSEKKARPLLLGGQMSLLSSPSLELAIDHDKGKCTGNVLKGKMQHWQLHEMDGHDLMHLRATLAEQDQLAVILLDLWLDREGPVHWRRDFSTAVLSTPTLTFPVTERAEAARILGVSPDDQADQVAQAKTRLETIIGKGGEHSTVLDMIAASAQLLSQ